MLFTIYLSIYRSTVTLGLSGAGWRRFSSVLGDGALGDGTLGDGTLGDGTLGDGTRQVIGPELVQLSGMTDVRRVDRR